MKHSRNALFFAVGLALALFIVACGSSTTTGSGSGTVWRERWQHIHAQQRLCHDFEDRYADRGWQVDDGAHECAGDDALLSHLGHPTSAAAVAAPVSGPRC